MTISPRGGALGVVPLARHQRLLLTFQVKTDLQMKRPAKAYLI